MAERVTILNPSTSSPASAPEIKPGIEQVQEGHDQLILQNPSIQCKLAIGSPDDPLEFEADAMADKILRMPEQNFIQRKCNHCEEDEKLQRKPLAAFIQRKESSGGEVASETITNQINSGKGSGSKMDNQTQSFMQERFGVDFGEIQIHTGNQSTQLNRELGAKAFTVRNNIYFNEGQYNPTTNDGKHLLAHELTHTIQQEKIHVPFLHRKIQAFIPEVVAAQLREAIEGWGTDENAIYAALAGRTKEEFVIIDMAYRRLTRRSLQADLEDDLTSSELTYLQNISTSFSKNDSDKASAIANQLHNAMAGWGTNEEGVYAALTGRSPELIASVHEAYLRMTGRSLLYDLRDELNDSEYRKAILMMNGNTIEQLLPYISGSTSIGTDAIESSNEYRTLMNPASTWQVEYQVKPAEARLICLLILNHLRSGRNFSWQADGVKFMESARKRLQHSASAQSAYINRLDVEIGIVSEQESISLFNELSNLTFFTTSGEEAPIPFHYPDNGCYARAHLMARRLTALGFSSQKEFVISMKDARQLTVQSDYSVDTNSVNTSATTTWWYHVAPVISVQQEDGSIVQKILDPSLDNHPITIREWTAKMRSDRFINMPFENVAEFLVENGNSFSGIGNITYTIDRDVLYPANQRFETAPGRANIQFLDTIPTMSDYAMMNVPAHELAFLIRQQLRNPEFNLEAVMLKARSMPRDARLFFLEEFPQLLSQLKSSGKIPESDYLNMIMSLHSP